uniref:LEM-like domain-containing protein n=1 Tax=Eptatretus burgeri TaxID=7764 RepID=A0A8C4QDT1_EPTBU
MSEIVEDPGSLTKERLKNELITHNVVLPPGDQRKHVYIELYTQFVMPTARKSRARTRAEFSSDEEEEPSRTRVTRSAKVRLGIWDGTNNWCSFGGEDLFIWDLGIPFWGSLFMEVVASMYCGSRGYFWVRGVGNYVFTRLSVCLSVSRISQKVVDRFG